MGIILPFPEKGKKNPKRKERKGKKPPPPPPPTHHTGMRTRTHTIGLVVPTFWLNNSCLTSSNWPLSFYVKAFSFL